jgi:tetratricopeptide (TPR) repeat protein
MPQHRERTEPDPSEVVRLAMQMYERDRTEQQRRSSLMAAAEEVGIPGEYLAKATAELKARQAHQPTVDPVQVTRRRTIVLLMAAFGLAMGTLMLSFLTYRRSEAPAPAVAIEAPPSVTGDHQGLAFSYLERGQWDAAAAEARRGISVTPNVADLHWILGKALFQKGDNAGALASAREAMRLNPAHTAFPLLLGEVLLKLGRREEAMAAWELVLKLDGGRNQWEARTARVLMERARLLN